MASTYSPNLGFELMAIGDQSGVWGTTTNTNIGTLLEQAISGYTTQAITDGADTTITIPNGATGVARNIYIECTGALTGARNLIVPANKKLYYIYNNTSGGNNVTIKVTGLTGVSVPNGAKVVVVSNGTDIVTSQNYLTSLTLGAALPIASGGTAGTTAAAARTNLGVSATGADTTYAFRSNNLSDLANAATSRTNLGSTATGDALFITASAAAARTTLGLATIASSGSATDLSSGTLPAARMVALTGDVTNTVGTVSTTIAALAVTYAKMQNISATSRILGRITGGAGSTEELTAANVSTILGLAPIATSGSAIDLTSGTLPGSRMAALTGDVTNPVNTLATTIAPAAVSLAKMANLAANSIIGNNTGGAAVPLALTAAQVRTLLALVTVATSGSAADLTTGTLPSARLVGAYTGMDGRNITAKTGTTKTLSTSAASAGADGDIWYKY